MRPCTTFAPVEAWTRHGVCIWTDTAPTRGRAAVVVRGSELALATRRGRSPELVLAKSRERELWIGDEVFYIPKDGWLVVGWDQNK